MQKSACNYIQAAINYKVSRCLHYKTRKTPFSPFFPCFDFSTSFASPFCHASCLILIRFIVIINMMLLLVFHIKNYNIYSLCLTGRVAQKKKINVNSSIILYFLKLTSSCALKLSFLFLFCTKKNNNKVTLNSFKQQYEEV